MTVTTRPRPPASMPPTAPPPSDPRDPRTEPDALIEEARRRARRRRRLCAAGVLLAAVIGAGAYLGSGRGGVDSSEPARAPEEPLVRIQAGPAASRMGNGPLAIMASEADSRGEGPSGWYGLSTSDSEDVCHRLLRVPVVRRGAARSRASTGPRTASGLCCR
jgi:hypothetical protein